MLGRKLAFRLDGEYQSCSLDAPDASATGQAADRAGQHRRIAVQLAEDGDTVDDATIRRPERRPEQAFGEISLREIAEDNASEQQQIICDPIPRVDGIEASADPLF